MIIKTCGMRDADNIRAVSELRIDWMGFIFWPPSSRYVSEKPTFLPTRQKRVGVFVDARIEEVKSKADEYALDLIQLHGSESPAFCERLKANSRQQLIKAFNIAIQEDLQQTSPYEGLVDYFLFDTKAKMVGGNGTQFDWSVLSAYQGNTPFLLSGGIGPDDAEKVRNFHHPQLAGIDLNSRFELSPALKDIEKLKQFITEYNEQD
ncbi:MAG: phosphoribosylanthranilate isomerase [Prevotella sp.]|nr:phosphoribosylanthranilate isomerase [Prevotella sp.]